MKNIVHRVCILGQNGQLGRALVNAFAHDASYEVHAFTRGQLDITDERAVEILLEEIPFDWVINAAAYTQVDQAEEDFEQASEVNAIGPGILAIHCDAKKIPLVHISSDYVYDNGLTRPLQEIDPTNPKSIYAESKRGGELEIQLHTDQYLILRTSWLYDVEGRNFVNTMLRLGQEREELHIVDDQVGAPTFAPDLAKAIHTMISHIDRLDDETTIPWGIYNFSNSGETNWCDFAESIFKLAGLKVKCHPVSTTEFNAPAHRPAYSIMSHEKIMTTFGIQPRHWHSALKNCLRLGGSLKA